MPAPLPTNAPEPLLSLFQDQGECRSPAPSSQDRPELWQPPRQLSLL
jgi:hypothetical protein